MVDVKLIKELRDRTGMGMSICKKSLEEASGDIEAAIVLLKKWGELKAKEKAHRVATEGQIGIYGNNSGSVCGIFEVNCETEALATSEEFFDLVYNSFSKMDNFSDLEFERKRQELVAKSGENIVLSRKEIYLLSDNNSSIHFYVHPGGKLAVLLEVSTNPIPTIPYSSFEVGDFADDCAMQVAAMAPLVVSKEELSEELVKQQREIFEAQVINENKPEQARAKIVEGKLAKWRKEIVLLEQDNIKEPKKTIDQLRQELGKKLSTEIKINRFVRYALGESFK